MKKIWTLNYRPFVMGGSVNYPISTDVEPIETREIKGIEFFTFKTPVGTIRLAEGITGAIVAADFDDLLISIETETKETLLHQVNDAKVRYRPEESNHLSNKEFFTHYRY